MSQAHCTDESRPCVLPMSWCHRGCSEDLTFDGYLDSQLFHITFSNRAPSLSYLKNCTSVYHVYVYVFPVEDETAEACIPVTATACSVRVLCAESEYSFGLQGRTKKVFGKQETLSIKFPLGIFLKLSRTKNSDDISTLCYAYDTLLYRLASDGVCEYATLSAYNALPGWGDMGFHAALQPGSWNEAPHFIHLAATIGRKLYHVFFVPEGIIPRVSPEDRSRYVFVTALGGTEFEEFRESVGDGTFFGNCVAQIWLDGKERYHWLGASSTLAPHQVFQYVSASPLKKLDLALLLAHYELRLTHSKSQDKQTVWKGQLKEKFGWHLDGTSAGSQAPVTPPPTPDVEFRAKTGDREEQASLKKPPTVVSQASKEENKSYGGSEYGSEKAFVPTSIHDDASSDFWPTSGKSRGCGPFHMPRFLKNMFSCFRH